MTSALAPMIALTTDHVHRDAHGPPWLSPLPQSPLSNHTKILLHNSKKCELLLALLVIYALTIAPHCGHPCSLPCLFLSLLAFHLREGAPVEPSFSPRTHQQAQILGYVVCKNMGDRGTEEELQERWRECVGVYRQKKQTIAVPITRMKVALARHRAIMFKYLADAVNIRAKIVKKEFVLVKMEG